MSSHYEAKKSRSSCSRRAGAAGAGLSLLLSPIRDIRRETEVATTLFVNTRQAPSPRIEKKKEKKSKEKNSVKSCSLPYRNAAACSVKTPGLQVDTLRA